MNECSHRPTGRLISAHFHLRKRGSKGPSTEQCFTAGWGWHRDLNPGVSSKKGGLPETSWVALGSTLSLFCLPSILSHLAFHTGLRGLWRTRLWLYVTYAGVIYFYVYNTDLVGHHYNLLEQGPLSSPSHRWDTGAEVTRLVQTHSEERV